MIKQKGFTPVLIILIIAILGVVGFLGFKRIKSNQISVSPSENSLNNSSCVDYDKLLSLTKELISSSVDNVDSLKDVEKWGEFLWTRKINEPMVGYPLIKAYAIFQPNGNNNGSNSAEKNADAVSGILTKDLKQKAEQLGLVEDKLNTTRFIKIRTNYQRFYQRFGFSKNGDFYLIETDYSPNYGARDGLVVNIYCAKPIEKYNILYDSLDIKIKPPSTDNPYDLLNYISISARDFSPDGRVFGIFGSSNYVGIENYYYFDGKNSRLVSDANGTCSDFENLKIGKGMKCLDRNANNVVREVTY